MTSVLVIGGTRFVGKRTVEAMLERGLAVTILSRNPNVPAGVEAITCERSAGLASLRGRHFDTVFDMIPYSAEDVSAVFQGPSFDNYALVSSIWLARLGVNADQPCSADQAKYPLDMLDATRGYLAGKIAAENAASEQRYNGINTTALRLPIMWGAGDHSKRAEFYSSRIVEGASLILVNGGHNQTQIAWSSDIAAALTAALISGKLWERPIWEALPDEAITVRAIAECIAVSLNIHPHLVSVARDVLKREMPEYLAVEPLHREVLIPRTSSNLFAAVGVRSTPYKQWIPYVSKRRPALAPDVREREAELLSRLQ